MDFPHTSIATFSMKASLTLLRTPLIKFVGGPHAFKTHAATVHPLAPNGLRPGASSSGSSSGSSYHNTNPVKPEAGVFFSRSELSQRFRYKALKESEIDNIATGGAEVVF